MSLTDELSKLHEVQKIDFQIYQREQAIKNMDDGNRLKQFAIDLLKRHDIATAELHKAEAAQRDRELALKSLEQKRATVHEKLYSGRVNNPKELGDLQKDEEMLDAQISELEGTVLELMEQTENARAIAVKLAGELTTAKRRWKDTVTRCQEETARLQKELAELRPKRVTTAAEVDKPLLRRYDEIRQRREGVGMVATGNDSCPACHVKLNPQVLSSLREGVEMTQCESCTRILLWITPRSMTDESEA